MNMSNNWRGDVAWCHAQEGHAGRPYWPGGRSGVTLDPGVDLGHCGRERAEHFILRHYQHLVDSGGLAALRWAYYKRGAVAHDLVRADQKVTSTVDPERKALLLRLRAEIRLIRVPIEIARAIFPEILDPYWRAVSDRFPALKTAPANVQTAFASLAYNRGATNNALSILGPPIAAGAWGEVADLVGAMQQTHKLLGIRVRRKLEAELIRTAV